MAAAIITSSTTLEGQFLEIAAALQSAEQAVTGDTQPNNIQLTIDSDDNEASVTAALPVAIANNAGKLEVTAEAYIAE